MSILELAACLAMALHDNDPAAIATVEAGLQRRVSEGNFAQLLAALLNAAALERVRPPVCRVAVI